MAPVPRDLICGVRDLGQQHSRTIRASAYVLRGWIQPVNGLNLAHCAHSKAGTVQEAARSSSATTWAEDTTLSYQISVFNYFSVFGFMVKHGLERTSKLLTKI
jgi:hypothetical protein